MMAQLAERAYSLDEYFMTERISDIKHEYYDGAIYAMAGGSPRHSRIAGKMFIVLANQLSGSSCEPFGSDLRIYTPSGLYTYPDISVVRGPLEFTDDLRTPSETVTNAIALVEVLSSATRNYDRRAKFDLYRAISTLRYYILSEQTSMHLELRTRNDADGWDSIVLSAPDEILELPALNFRCALSEIYERVTFD